MDQDRTDTSSNLEPSHSMAEFLGHELPIATVSSIPQDEIIVSKVPLSRHMKAKAIADSFTRAIQLPEFLFAYRPLVGVLGAFATGVGFYHLFEKHRQNRAKVQLAVFHITRIVELQPDHETVLHDPRELFRRMEDELAALLETHLSTGEGRKVYNELKRKLREDDLPPAKRQRSYVEPEEERHKKINEQEGHCAMDDGATPASVNDNDLTNEVAQERQTFSTNRHTPRSRSLRDFKSQPPITPPRPREGYGFTYEEFSSSSSSPQTSPTASLPPKKTPKENTPPKIQPVQELGIVERAMLKAFDPNSPGNRGLPMAVKRGFKSYPRTPSTAMASRYEVSGTDLPPIDKANSAHSSPGAECTHYRVNETRRLHTSIQSGLNNSRRSVKDVFKPDASPVLPVTTQNRKSASPKQKKSTSPHQQQQQQQQVAEEWDDVIIDYSPSEYSFGSIKAELAGPLATPPHPRSPSRPVSLDSEASSASSQPPAVTRAAGASHSSLRSSGANLERSSSHPVAASRSYTFERSVPANTASSPPITPSPPKKRKGPGHPPNTPGRVPRELLGNTPSRRSMRTTAFKGPFQK
ncbi:hypothetical protein K458DRAFT_428222 [Lentithecium fluviatile CBS 122367]|uniref:Uncharacterized protein n=1 Tax=Lentithecium fluviatile CBS 122367 TaxID=1168545 RepID=A0A6G1JEV5_9PLEO|nr:hypothetical protein K458DRAFT_428222 [Lentithecium fluviatile CBS 122367]